MRILVDGKNDKDVKSYGLDDEAIKQAAKEITQGLIDADLGGGLIKKRIARGNRGKSAGWRCLIVRHSDDIAVLVHLFPKGEKANITAKEKKNLLKLAKIIRNTSVVDILATAKREKWRTI